MSETLVPKVLLDEMRQIPLGVALCDALDDLGVQVVIDDAALDGFRADEDDAVFGAYRSSDNVIYLRAGSSMAVAMHVLAHEARHALQIHAERVGIDRLSHFNLMANPAAYAINTRLREIDADVFAVYFLYVHAVETFSAHFDDMIDSRYDDAKLMHRAGLYKAFYETWKKNEGSHHDVDVRHAMKAVATAWLKDDMQVRSYDVYICREWSENVLPVFNKVVLKEKTPWLTRMSEHAQQEDGYVAKACAAALDVYASLLQEAGYPRWVPDDTGRAIDMMLHNTPLDDEVSRAVTAHETVCAQMRISLGLH